MRVSKSKRVHGDELCYFAKSSTFFSEVYHHSNATLSNCQSPLSGVGHTARTILSSSNALFNGIRQIGFTGTDVRTEDIGTIAWKNDLQFARTAVLLKYKLTFIVNSKSQLFALVTHERRITDLIKSIKVRWVIALRYAQIYTVRLPIGGRKTLMSGRVINSGYIPPVSSNNARRSKLSDLINVRVR